MTTLIDDLVRLEAAQDSLANSGPIDRIVAPPWLETPPDHRRFNRLSTRDDGAPLFSRRPTPTFEPLQHPSPP